MSNNPPPPPPTDTKLASLKTYILIAWIFSILIMIVWLLAAVSTILSYLAVASLTALYIFHTLRNTRNAGIKNIRNTIPSMRPKA